MFNEKFNKTLNCLMDFDDEFANYIEQLRKKLPKKALKKLEQCKAFELEGRNYGIDFGLVEGDYGTFNDLEIDFETDEMCYTLDLAYLYEAIINDIPFKNKKKLEEMGEHIEDCAELGSLYIVNYETDKEIMFEFEIYQDEQGYHIFMTKSIDCETVKEEDKLVNLEDIVFYSNLANYKI